MLCAILGVGACTGSPVPAGPPRSCCPRGWTLEPINASEMWGFCDRWARHRTENVMRSNDCTSRPQPSSPGANRSPCGRCWCRSCLVSGPLVESVLEPLCSLEYGICRLACSPSAGCGPVRLLGRRTSGGTTSHGRVGDSTHDVRPDGDLYARHATCSCTTTRPTTRRLPRARSCWAGTVSASRC
jgi:hypothetical protein